MKNQENGFHISGERHSSLERNLAELVRLKEQAEEMYQEIKEGKLGEAAKQDLQNQLGDTLQAIQILRESIAALQDEDAIFVGDSTDPTNDVISVEITDPLGYWLQENQMRVQEIRELLDEIDSYQGKDLSDDTKVRISKIESDIEKLRQEANYTMEKYFESA